MEAVIPLKPQAVCQGLLIVYTDWARFACNSNAGATELKNLGLLFLIESIKLLAGMENALPAKPYYLHTCIASESDCGNCADYRTSLMIAASNGQISLVRLLLRYDADISIKDDNGWTADDYAVMNGHHACSHLIIEHGTKKRPPQSPHGTSKVKGASVFSSPIHGTESGFAVGGPATDKEVKDGAGDSWPSSDEGEELDFSPKKIQKPSLTKLMNASQKSKNNVNENGNARPQPVEQSEPFISGSEGDSEKERTVCDEPGVLEKATTSRQSSAEQEENESENEEEDEDDEEEDEEEEGDEDEDEDLEDEEEYEEEEASEEDDGGVASLEHENHERTEITMANPCSVVDETIQGQETISRDLDETAAIGTSVAKDEVSAGEVVAGRDENVAINEGVAGIAGDNSVSVNERGAADEVTAGDQLVADEESSEDQDIEVNEVVYSAVVGHESLSCHNDDGNAESPDRVSALADSWDSEENDFKDEHPEPKADWQKMEETNDVPVSLIIGHYEGAFDLTTANSWNETEGKNCKAQESKIDDQTENIACEENSRNEEEVSQNSDLEIQDIQSGVCSSSVMGHHKHEEDNKESGEESEASVQEMKMEVTDIIEDSGANIMNSGKDSNDKEEVALKPSPSDNEEDSWDTDQENQKCSEKLGDDFKSCQEKSDMSHGSRKWDEGAYSNTNDVDVNKSLEKGSNENEGSEIIIWDEDKQHQSVTKQGSNQDRKDADDDLLDYSCEEKGNLMIHLQQNHSIQDIEKGSESDISWGERSGRPQEPEVFDVNMTSHPEPLQMDQENRVVRTTEKDRSKDFKLLKPATEMEEYSEEEEEDEDEEEEEYEDLHISGNILKESGTVDSAVPQNDLDEKGSPAKNLKRDFLSELGLEAAEEDEDSPWDSESASDSPRKQQSGALNPAAKAQTVMHSISEEKNEEPSKPELKGSKIPDKAVNSNKQDEHPSKEDDNEILPPVQKRENDIAGYDKDLDSDPEQSAEEKPKCSIDGSGSSVENNTNPDHSKNSKEEDDDNKYQDFVNAGQKNTTLSEDDFELIPTSQPVCAPASKYPSDEELEGDMQRFKNEVGMLKVVFLALEKEKAQLQKEVEGEKKKKLLGKQRSNAIKGLEGPRNVNRQTGDETETIIQHEATQRLQPKGMQGSEKLNTCNQKDQKQLNNPRSNIKQRANATHAKSVYEYVIEREKGRYSMLSDNIAQLLNERKELQKALEDIQEVKSTLEHQQVEWETDLNNQKFILKQEQEKHKNAEMLYEKSREQLRKKEEQFRKEVEAKQQLELTLRNLEMEMRALISNMKQLEDERNEVQRLLSQERSARALQEGILNNHLHRQKEIEEENKKTVSKSTEVFSQLSEVSDREKDLLQQNRSLQDEISVLKLELDRVRARSQEEEGQYLEENEALKEKMEDLKRDLKLNEEALAQTVLQYSGQLNALKTESTMMTSKLEQEKQNKDKLETDVESLRARLTSALQELERSQSGKVDAKRTFQRERDEWLRLQEKRTHETTSLRDSINSLSQQLSKAEAKANSLENECHRATLFHTEKSLQLESMQREREQAQSRLKELEGLLQAEKEQASKSSVRQESMQERMAQAQSENILLRQQLEEAQNKGIIKERAVSDVQDRFSDILTNLRADSEGRVQIMEERNKELMAKNVELREQVYGHQNEKAEREAQKQSMLSHNAQDSHLLWEEELKSRSKLGHRLAQLEREKVEVTSQIDELSQQLEKESLQSTRLESTNNDLREQLSSMKALRKSHEKLERSKRQLEEEVSSVRRHMETMIEQCRREAEERARQEIRQKLEEVNLFLQTQAASQEALEQIKATNEATLRNQLEQRIRDLEGELSRARSTQQNSLSQRDSTQTELERYKELYSQEFKLRKSLAAKLDRKSSWVLNMQKELEKSITKELDHATADLDGGSTRMSPVGSAAGSLKSLNLDQDPVARATQQYLEVLKKNYMI
ncbi:UNVERIFIED_CONTAM: hypothetical protein FKN15_053200 [Acipenser sinensis]